MSMVRMDSDLIARQVSLGHTWCLILSLVSVWRSPLCDMSDCPLLTSVNKCLEDNVLIPNCTSGKYVYELVTDTLNRGSGMVGPIGLVWPN